MIWFSILNQQQLSLGHFKNHVRSDCWPMLWLRAYLDLGWPSQSSLRLVRNAIESFAKSYADCVASTTRFRDALLYRHPVILDAFLEKAVDFGDNDVNKPPLPFQPTPC